MADNASSDATRPGRVGAGGHAAGRGGGPARGEGPRPGAQAGVARLRRTDPGVHGRRPVHRPRRPVAPARTPDVRPLRHGHRLAARTGLEGGSRAQARGHLAVLQPDAARGAGGPVQRRPVRVQGGSRRCRGRAAAPGRGHHLVLRHRAARARGAVRAADPRGARRLVRRPRLAGRRGRHRAGRPARGVAAQAVFGVASAAGRRHRRPDRAPQPRHRHVGTGAAVRGGRWPHHRHPPRSVRHPARVGGDVLADGEPRRACCSPRSSTPLSTGAGRSACAAPGPPVTSSRGWPSSPSPG